MPNFKVSMWRLVHQTFELEIECETEQDAISCMQQDVKEEDRKLKDSWVEQVIKESGIEVVKLADDEEQEEEADEETSDVGVD